MSKNISNIAINGNKNVYNQSKIRASQVSYNNTFSGLTGTNVQQAIDELSTGSGGGTPAEPFSEGIVYGKTLGDTVSLGLNANNNNYPDNITIGHNAANGVLSYNNNTIIGNECLQNYTTSAVTNNTIIGNNNYTNTVSIPSVVDNIVIGNNITCISGPDELQNNILIGKGITSNCDDSIIINTDNNFTKNFNNMFYIGNGIKQPFSSNEFLISNGYNKYIIDGISSYGHDKIYLNYAITDDNSTDPQTPGVPPIPTDIFSTYKQINTIGTTSNEVTFTYVMAPSSDYILVSNYAYITPIQEPNITSIPSGNWVFNITGFVDISGDSFIIAKVFTFNSGFETLLFTTAPEPMLTSANPKIKIISPQPTITLIQSDRIVVKLYTYTTGAFSRVAQVLFDGQINQCYIDVPLTVNNNKTNFIVHYDQDTGTITKQPINNADESPTSKKVLKKDTYGRTLFRTFTGSNGITVTELSDELDFSFNTGLLPLEMEPTVAGLAYGKQDQGILFTGLGRELVPKDRSISLFNQSGSGDIQNYNGTDNILINNIDNQNSNTNAIMSNIITNNCVTKDCNFDHSIVLASELDMGGISAESCTLIGNFKGHVIGNCREAMYISNNVGPGNLNLNGRQSLYLGNATYPETVNDRDAYISGYDRFFLRTPQNATQSYQLYYEPTSSEVTWDLTPAAYNLPIKLPTTLGGSYGLNFAASGTEMTGRNSFNNYASGVNVSGITSVGNNHFTLNTSTTFSDSMIFGNTVRFNSLLNMTNSLIASNILNNTGVTSIANDLIIMPKASSLTVAPGITSLTGACFLTSSDIALTNVDPNYSVVVASASTVNPGSNNMILISGGSNSIITMQGLGNMLFQASGSSTNYTSAAFNNGVIFNSGSTTVAATANSQFNACHTTLRMPNLNLIGTNVNSNNVRLMGYDTSTGLISPYLTNTFSRVYRQQANTNAAGSVTFNTGTVVSNTPGTTYHCQVINASLTTAYTCQTTSVTVNTVTIQVFQSTNAVLGAPTMIPAPANIVVSFSMNY